ncbi:MAG: hypothetical protein AAGD07_02640 [Planctomycetota bacterium]
MSQSIWLSQLNQSDPEIQREALRALAAEERVEGLAIACLNCLASDDADVRTWASEALGSSVAVCEAELDAVVAYLSPDVAVAVSRDQAYWAATILGRLAHPRMASPLVALATNSGDARLDVIRDRAIRSLTRLEVPPAECLSTEEIDRLKQMIQSETDTRRATIAKRWLDP